MATSNLITLEEAFHRLARDMRPFGLDVDELPPELLDTALDCVANTITRRSEEFMRGVIAMVIRLALLQLQRQR